LPRISEFYGIVIAMFFNDHDPLQFHAIYAKHRASVRITPIEILDGNLPGRAQALTFEWAIGRQKNCVRIGKGRASTNRWSRFLR
jgi:Domain of unknown function (DUF4160)